METNKVYLGNSIDTIKTFPDECIDCVVTSPPYYGLRDYGVDGQIGLEETPEAYIQRLVELFREIRRVLRKDGTIWVNIGDSYCGTGDKGNYRDPKYPEGRNGQAVSKNKKLPGLKSKDLIGIPWMLAFALRADGWYLRQDIIWHKPNPMPESVTDRCTKSHEYIFLLSKSEKYYFDNEAIQEDAVGQESPQTNKLKTRTHAQGYSSAGRHRDNSGGLSTQTIIKDGVVKRSKRDVWSVCVNPSTKNCQYDGQRPNSMHINREMGMPDKEYFVRNKRDVWSVNVRPNTEAHFATYPEMLIRPCILAGCPENGVVLDPFMGSGTTGIVARKLNRNYVGCELNPEYKKMAERRIAEHGENLFNQDF